MFIYLPGLFYQAHQVEHQIPYYFVTSLNKVYRIKQKIERVIPISKKLSAPPCITHSMSIHDNFLYVDK